MAELTHFDERGASRMVDVSGKAVTLRTARASGLVRMEPATLALDPRPRAGQGGRPRGRPAGGDHGGEADRAS